MSKLKRILKSLLKSKIKTNNIKKLQINCKIKLVISNYINNKINLKDFKLQARLMK